MAEQETETEWLQKVVDKAKTIGLLDNIHNLSPPIQQREDYAGKVAIIESLKVTPRLQHLFLELQGMIWDENTKQIIKISEPIMNIKGSFKFVAEIKRISEEMEWSNFHEDEINLRIFEYYRNIFPYFTFWHEEYELSPRNFDYIGTVLMAFIDSAFHKAKGGKLLNVTGRVYSEDFLGKALQAQEEKKGGNFLSRFIPRNPAMKR